MTRRWRCRKCDAEKPLDREQGRREKDLRGCCRGCQRRAAAAMALALQAGGVRLSLSHRLKRAFHGWPVEENPQSTVRARLSLFPTYTQQEPQLRRGPA